MRFCFLKKTLNEHFAIKVFAAFTILLFAISLSFAAFFVHRQGDSMKDALIKNGRLLSKLLAHNSKIGVFSENKELLNNPVDGVMQQEEVLKVSLFNQAGDILIEREKSGEVILEKSGKEDRAQLNGVINNIKRSGSPYNIEDDEWFEFWSPVLSNSGYSTDDSLFFRKDISEKKEQIIGFVRITIDKRPLHKQINALVINSILIALILLTIGSVLVYLFIKSITGPLNRLTEGVRKLGRGEAVERLPEETSDEIGKLASAFNNMSESLSNREKALKESEEKYRRLFELESDALFLIKDKTGAILEINLTASRLYGYSREELLMMNERDLSVEYEDDRQPYPGKVISIPVCYHRKKDGTVFPVESAVTYFSWQGKDVRISAIRDISERITAEKERARLETKLRQAQKMEAIGTLAGGIAHDFNNIIGIIAVNTQLAMYDVPEAGQTHENLEEILKACLRARDMVRQILAFSRKDEARVKPVMIVPLIKESIKLLKSSILATIEINQDIRSESDIIMADSTQIHQILMNLFSNAAYALKETGGIITVILDNIELVEGKPADCPDLIPGKYLRLSVSDTGQGIPSDILDRVFDPYFTTKKVGEGTGMGLAIAHGIVKSHGGAITVESEPGKGTTFQMLFPVIDANIGLEDECEVFCPGGTEHILFVDDEKSISDAMSVMLTRLGYKVTSRTNSIEALELFRENHESFDLMITDLVMPHMTGLELSKEVFSIRPDMPIILCTGYSETINDEMTSQTGIRCRKNKPFVISEMATIIREALDHPVQTDDFTRI